MKHFNATKRFFIHKCFVLCFISLVISSCSKENESVLCNMEKDVPVQLAAIKFEGTMRAVGSQWEDGDKIGVFAIKGNTSLEADNIVDANNNVLFQTNGDGYFIPQNKSIYYPKDGSLMDIIAYYPHTANITNFTYDIDITKQLDFFYSNNLKGISKTNTQNNVLHFKRPLSKLIINVSSKDGRILSDLTAVMKGGKTKASFSLSAGILTIDNSSVTEFALPISENGKQKQVSSLMLPTNKANQLEITFKESNLSYTWKVPHVLEAGKAYSYNIKLDKGDVVIVSSGYMEVPAYSMGGEAPNSYKALHMVQNKSWLNPSYPIPNESVRNYTILFDKKNRLPYWVAFPMHPIYLKSGNRTDAWDYDPIIPREYQPTLFNGWSTRGWDRGHLLASADRNASREINKTTFYFTNMAPQEHAMNGGTWGKLEERVRYWCKQSKYDTLYVVTGCILPKAPEVIKYINDNDGKSSAIPKYLYKALLRKQKSTQTYTSIAFKMENANTGIDYTNSIVSVSELEKDTGFTFFPSLPADVAPDVKKNKNLSPHWN